MEDRIGRAGDEEVNRRRGRRGGGLGRLMERVELPEAGHGAGEVVGLDCLGDAVGECFISRRGGKEVSRGWGKAVDYVAVPVVQRRLVVLLMVVIDVVRPAVPVSDGRGGRLGSSGGGGRGGGQVGEGRGGFTPGRRG